MDAAWLEFKHLHGLALLSCAKYDADGFLLGFLPLVAVEPAQIELHLPGVGGLEVADLELDNDQPTETPVEKEQVEVIVVAVQRDTFLTLQKGESGTKLEKERFDLPKQSVLQILLAVSCL